MPDPQPPSDQRRDALDADGASDSAALGAEGRPGNADDLPEGLTAPPEGVDRVPAGEVDAWADDIRWALKTQSETSFDAMVPASRLNEALTDYEIVRELGRGGMGVVYEAVQLRLQRRVALKVLPALLGAVRPDAIPRFAREAELAAGLEHTNIIGVYDFGQVDGTFYYAMQLIEGRSLAAILREINETGAIDVVIGEATRQQGNEAEKKVGSGKSEVRSGSEQTVPRSASRVSSSVPQSAIRNPKWGCLKPQASL